MPAPLAFAAGATSGLVAASLLRSLGARRSRLCRSNFRGRAVVLAGGAAGAVTVAGALIAARVDVPARVGLAAALAATAAGLLGLYDDLVGESGPKGLRGHLGALRRGRLTTGAAKLLGIGAAALAAAAILDVGGPLRVLACGGVIAGCANLVNLLDLRPGRAGKVVLVAGLALVAGGNDATSGVAAWTAGVALGVLPHDLRERTMLGDAGANALGAALGVVLAARTAEGAGAFVALAALVALTALSERISFSRVIDGVAPLRWVDRLGRAA